MRPSNKSRSRNKNNNRRNNGGNVINRVFDSSGPEGKVRGTPQQIIDKYQALARDAQLSGDRIAHENFLQHSEHYSRLLGAAQREMNERREAQEAQQAQRQQNQQTQKETKSSGDAAMQNPGAGEQPDLSKVPEQELFPAQTEDESNLVETPETSAPKRRGKRPAKPAAKDEKELSEPKFVEAPNEGAAS